MAAAIISSGEQIVIFEGIKMKSAIITFLLICAALLTGAETKLTLTGLGKNHLKKFSELKDVSPHRVYGDLLIGCSNGNQAVFPLPLKSTENLTGLIVETEIQTAAPNGPRLEVLLKLADGKEIPLHIQRGNAAHKFTWQKTELRKLDTPGAELIFRFRDIWFNANRESNFSFRSLKLTLFTKTVERPPVTFDKNLNVFTTQQDAVFNLNISGDCFLTNTTGSIQKKLSPVTSRKVNAGKLPQGFYRVWSGKQEIARFAVVTPGLQRSAVKSVAQADFGRKGHWTTAMTARCSELAQLAGVNYVRERYGWGWASTEPQKGKFNLDELKGWLKTEQQYGLKVIMHFMGLPRWAKQPGDSGYGDLRETYHSAKEHARRLNGLVTDWEYWNEPDSWPFGRGPAHNAAAGQKAMFLGIRAGNPAVHVASAPPSNIHIGYAFMEDMLENGFADWFDSYNSHIYHLPEEYEAAYKRHFALQKKYNFFNRLKFITEGGAENSKHDAKKYPPPWDKEASVPRIPMNTAACDVHSWEMRQQVSGALLRNWVKSAQYRWDRYYTFCFAYYNEAGGNRIWGMLAPGFTATHSYATLAAYNWLIGSMEYKGKIQNLPPKIEGHLFSDGRIFRSVCWSLKGAVLKLSAADKVFAASGDTIPHTGKVKLSSIPVFVEYAAPPAAQRNEALFAVVPQKVEQNKNSRIILDFVRDETNGKYRVNTNRRHVLTSPGEIIKGKLFIYNFSDTGKRQTIQPLTASGWQCPAAFTVEIPPWSRIEKTIQFTAPSEFYSGVKRVGFSTDHGKSKTLAAFVCAPELNIVKRTAISGITLQGGSGTDAVIENGMLKINFGGKSPYAAIKAPLPAKADTRGDGILFTLSKPDRKSGQAGYIDVVIYNTDGTASRLSPNIFPVFLDGVQKECHVISYNQLQPPTSPEKAHSVTITLSSFGPAKVQNRLEEFSIWEAKNRHPHL